MKKSIPFVSFSKVDLAKLEDAEAGQRIICPKCNEMHELIAATNEAGKATNTLFYKCGEDAYLGAVSGRRLR